MAAFIATKAVDMGDLSELGLLSNFKQLKTPSVTDLSSFAATKGNVSLFITGSHMTAVLKVPSSGTMDGIQVSVGGKVQYAVNNLGLPFGNTQKTFKGDFEPTLFKGADVITGSDAGDTLDGYAGNDTISGRGGDDDIAGSGSNDTINGGRGNDIISGNAGADILDGGVGSDMLSGGAGRDTFVFDNKLNGTAAISGRSLTLRPARTSSTFPPRASMGSASPACFRRRPSSSPRTTRARTMSSCTSRRPASCPTTPMAAAWRTPSSSPRSRRGPTSTTAISSSSDANAASVPARRAATTSAMPQPILRQPLS
jgi:hypothetical protein